MTRTATGIGIEGRDSNGRKSGAGLRRSMLSRVGLLILIGAEEDGYGN